MNLRNITFGLIITLILIISFQIPIINKLPIYHGVWRLETDFLHGKKSWVSFKHLSSKCRVMIELELPHSIPRNTIFSIRSKQFLTRVLFHKDRSQTSYLHKLNNCLQGLTWLKSKEVKLIQINKPSSSWGNNIFLLRKTLVNYLDQRVEKPFSEYLKTLFVGDKSGFSRNDSELFKNFGLLYLLAISGFHVQFLYQGINRFSYLLPGNPLSKSCLILVPFFLYVPISGFGPAVMRATLSPSLVIVSQLTQTNIKPVHLLFMNALICLCINPSWIFHLGFQLSFLATLGIQELKFINFKPNSIAIGVRATTMTLPLILLYFEKLSMVGFVAQILVAPWIALTMLIGIKFVILDLIGVSYKWTQIYTYLFKMTHHYQIQFLSLLKPLNEATYIFPWQNGVFYLIYFTWIIWVVWKINLPQVPWYKAP